MHRKYAQTLISEYARDVGSLLACCQIFSNRSLLIMICVQVIIRLRSTDVDGLTSFSNTNTSKSGHFEYLEKTVKYALLVHRVTMSAHFLTPRAKLSCH
jgi:hypothetical protein